MCASEEVVLGGLSRPSWPPSDPPRRAWWGWRRHLVNNTRISRVPNVGRMGALVKRRVDAADSDGGATARTHLDRPATGMRNRCDYRTRRADDRPEAVRSAAQQTNRDQWPTP